MATAAILTALTPLVSAEGEEDLIGLGRCVPAQDEGARRLQTTAGTFYVRLYPNQGYFIEETWQEQNGESGLQYSSGMSCVGLTDKLVISRCIGACPIAV